MIKFDPDDPVLAEVRAHALGFPQSTESITHGRPWFSAGTVFAVYGGATKGPARVEHPRSILVRAHPADLPARRQDPRFYLPAYFAPKGWVGIDLAQTDWKEVDELIEDSFRMIATVAMVKDLDRNAGRP